MPEKKPTPSKPLCRLLGQPTPAEVHTAGEKCTFEKGPTKTPGGQGWGDVWYKDHFALEHKGSDILTGNHWLVPHV